LQRRHDWETDEKLSNPEPLPLPSHPIVKHIFGVLEDELERINLSNLDHTWKAFVINPETGQRHVFQPNVCLRQIHSDRLLRGARLYSWTGRDAQLLSKEQRKTILIDGEPVAELDYSGYATRMLYHLNDQDPHDDIYRPQLIFPRFWNAEDVEPEERDAVRGFIKKATNICWNVDSQSEANSSVGKLLVENIDREFLMDEVYETEGSNPKDIVDRIQRAAIGNLPGTAPPTSRSCCRKGKDARRSGTAWTTCRPVKMLCVFRQ